ncbi:MAG TPA: hypothetical protein ENI76_01145, partial [Ignavibacteria bacterium]|nr:hypothetical protein [Ignavibacteria bacterium]
MKSKLKNFLGELMIAWVFALPMKVNAQMRPINQTTPWQVIGNFFERPYINYEAGRDSSNFYGSKGTDWDTLKTREERISFLKKILSEEYKLRQTQAYHGFDNMQAFINLHGISSIGEWNKLSTKYGGNSYDITSNARFNLPAAIVDTFNKNNWQTSRLDGFLVGNDPIKYKSWYVFDPSDSNKEVDISNSKYISINSDGYVKSFFGDPIFTFMPNMVRWGFKNGVQNDTIMVDPTLWRNSPNATTLSLTAPKDTTINYEKSVDLSKENLGEVKVKTNLKLGKELDFYARNEYVGGHVVGMGYIEKTSSIVDTVYLSNDKKDFRVKKKTLVKLIEDNTVYNSTYPNGRHWKHTIKKDSVYQTITVDHITSVGDAGNDVPKKFEVSQNFPNPFNPS